MKYRKKPIIVEAFKLDQEKLDDSPLREDALDIVRRYPLAFQRFMIYDDGWLIRTVDGNEVTVPWGAYVVIDSKGYAYPCDAEIFEANHEPAE